MQQPDPPTVEIVDRWTTVGDDRTRDGYDVIIDGQKLPCPAAGYEVGEGEAGPTVMLAIAAGAVMVGGKPPVTTPSGRTARTWGSGRDPRG